MTGFAPLNPSYLLASFLYPGAMAYEIVLAPETVEDLRALKANTRPAVRRAIEIPLRHEPGKASRSRIKRLRGLRRPQYRLRVGETRVFYDIPARVSKSSRS